MASPTPKTKQTAEEERALMLALEEEEAKNRALLAAEEAARAAAAIAQAQLDASPPLPPVIAGSHGIRYADPPKPPAKDWIVSCLVDNPYCCLGGRRYALKKGAEIMMDPSHAQELGPLLVVVRDRG